MGWGTQPLWIPPFRFPVSRLPYDAATCRPSGALVIWCMPRFYKHVAPLGLKAAFPFRDDARHRRGGVPPPDGLGNPTPTDTTSFPRLPILTRPVFRFTCRLSGALGYLVYVAVL